ncbi:MAG: molybdate ABC transporter permease subunit [Granulosicoccaceae bacterium]|jgi:molybdate transport system permease protein
MTTLPDTVIDLSPLWLTLQLAAMTVVILFILATPIAWWLAYTRSRLKTTIEAVTALPLVLPPTVLGFYLLVLLGPNGPAGQVWTHLFGQHLAFSFTGLVIASCIYSLPFVVQPLQAAFEGMNRQSIEASWTLGSSRLRTFVRVVIPQVRRGALMALVLGFAHTMGEFGVVLMVGGNIPGETQVVSIAIYEQVETLNFAVAHQFSASLLVFSFVVLFLVYAVNRSWNTGVKT